MLLPLLISIRRIHVLRWSIGCSMRSILWHWLFLSYLWRSHIILRRLAHCSWLLIHINIIVNHLMATHEVSWIGVSIIYWRLLLPHLVFGRMFYFLHCYLATLKLIGFYWRRIIVPLSWWASPHFPLTCTKVTSLEIILLLILLLILPSSRGTSSHIASWLAHSSATCHLIWFFLFLKVK